jgi:hypothetical protein
MDLPRGRNTVSPAPFAGEGAVISPLPIDEFAANGPRSFWEEML